MTFLSLPLALIAAGILTPALVILYFLKLRRRDVEVSTTLLWKKAVQDMQANAPFQRLRRNILLLLQLLVLGAVLMALAQPMLRGTTLSGTRHVILLDRSASMQSEDGSQDAGSTRTRLEEAKRQALALVDSMREGDRFFASGTADTAMVIAFDTVADPVQPFTTDKRLLRQAIERVSASERPTSVEEAVRVALAHMPVRRRVDERTGQEQVLTGLTQGEPITIHVFSDGRLPDALGTQAGPENTVIYHQIGETRAPNVAITALKAERDFGEPAKVTIFASLLSTASNPRTLDAELLLDGQVARIQSVTIPGAVFGAARGNDGVQTPPAETEDGSPAATEDAGVPGTTGVLFQVERTEGMLAQVRLRDPATGQRPGENVLEVDDRAWVVVPPARRLAVALVGRRSLFVKSVLEGMPLSRVDEFTTTEFERAWNEGRAGTWDVVILDGDIPNVGQGAVTVTPTQAGAPGAGTANASGVSRMLPPGNFLVLGVVPAGLGLGERGAGAEAAGAASIIDWSRDHPVTRNLVLDPVRIAAFREVAVDPARGATVLATAERGPAVLEVSDATTHALVVPFDYMESNWPLDLSFVVFVASSVNYLGGEVGARLDARALRPGGELRDRLPSGARDVRITHAQGQQATLDVGPDGTILHRLPADLGGVYEVTWDGPLAPGDVRTDGGRALRVYAANLLDAQESDVPAASTLPFANTVASATTQREAPGDRRLWPWLVLAGLAVVMLEWFIYNRKVQV